MHLAFARTFPSVRRQPLAAGVVLALALGAGAAPAAAGTGALPAPDGHAAAAMLARLSAPARPARVSTPAADTWPVTSCADDGGAGTLRSVVASAQSGDVVDLGGLSCSTITLVSGAIQTSLDDLTLQGPTDHVLTIDGADAGRVIEHGGGGILKLENLALAHGKVVADKAYGGCIYSNGSVSLSRSTISACSALGDTLAAGGAILSKDIVSMYFSEVSDSIAEAAVGQAGAFTAGGGGVFASNTTGLLFSTVTGNVAHTALGKCYAGGVVTGSLTSKYSTISDNEAISVGDVQNYSIGGAAASFVSTFISGSTFDHNASDIAGALFLPDSPNTATIADSTISTNTARLMGGGIVVYAGLDFVNSTLAFNTAGPFGIGGLGAGVALTMHSSLLAGNVPTDLDVGDGVIIDGAHNLVQLPGQAVMLPPGTISADPLLAPLENRGGPTQVHALLDGSPAIDAGSNPNNLTNEQRGVGFPRVVGIAADIGAYETDPDRLFTHGFD